MCTPKRRRGRARTRAGTVANVTSGDAIDVDRYLARLGIADETEARRLGAAGLMRAHLVAVPFENLDIVFAGGVPHDPRAAFDKIVGGRGGWCFELNEPFAHLLSHVGYDVLRLGAAVLLGGPTRVLEHLALEVSGGPDGLGPMLVDVGFGDSFDVPLHLNRAGLQPGGHADFELIPSPEGTTLAEYVDGVPAARYRFKRVAHAFDDFAAVAASMQVDPAKNWHRTPFTTRLLGTGDDRVTLTHDRLKLRRGGAIEERPVARDEWDALLAEWFSMERPGPWPDDAT